MLKEQHFLSIPPVEGQAAGEGSRPLQTAAAVAGLTCAPLE